ncbi:MAG: class I SAM-dependent methyltransferase [Myxococcota bacterium]|jgi:demethylmenaquinone methyltransferase/2-methoxy-6-polyprenyl-1,4-benzoquinol methylase
MGIYEKVAFFDGIAGKWDGWEDREGQALKFREGLLEFGVAPDERVLDVGCGTGNLTLAIAGCLSAKGRVTGIDISTAMVDVARSKTTDDRVEYVVGDIEKWPLKDQSFDRVICFSVWPHIENPLSAARKIRAVLKPGGRMHIWHLISRQKVNEIHSTAGHAVYHDILFPAVEVAAILENAGFNVVDSIDDDARYLVTAVKDQVTRA